MTATADMSKAELKRLERIHVLRTLLNYGPEMTGLQIVERANSECDHDLLDALPPITNRGVGQKLNAMSLDGLVTGSRSRRYRRNHANPPMVWSITEKGRDLARSLAPPADDRHELAAMNEAARAVTRVVPHLGSETRVVVFWRREDGRRTYVETGFDDLRARAVEAARRLELTRHGREVTADAISDVLTAAFTVPDEGR